MREIMLSRSSTSVLPPHLDEVCAILARGLVRLHRHTTGELARGTERTQGQGDNSLHFVPNQSGHAKPNRRRHA